MACKTIRFFLLPLPTLIIDLFQHNLYNLQIMKYVRLFFAITLAFVAFSAFTLKDKEKLVHAFGVAVSFKDSVVYYTEIQVLDSVKLNKTDFLPKRESYTYQLKNYLEYTLNKQDYTCMIYFSESKKKLERDLSKVKGKYKKVSGSVLQKIGSADFIFKKPQE